MLTLHSNISASDTMAKNYYHESTQIVSLVYILLFQKRHSKTWMITQQMMMVSGTTM